MIIHAYSYTWGNEKNEGRLVFLIPMNCKLNIDISGFHSGWIKVGVDFNLHFKSKV